MAWRSKTCNSVQYNSMNPGQICKIYFQKSSDCFTNANTSAMSQNAGHLHTDIMQR